VKKAFVLIMTTVIMLTLAACGSEAETNVPETSNTEDNPITLRAATHHSSASPTGQSLLAWFDDLSVESGGTVNVDASWDSTLIAPPNAYSETVSGVTDIEIVAPGNAVDHFVADTAITYFYGGRYDMATRIKIAKELYEATPEWQTEYEGVEPLFFGTAGETFFIISTKPVASLADIKNLNIRVMEQWAFDLMKSLGANPVKMPLGEMYESLQKGVIDAVLLCESHYETESLADYCGYMTDMHISPAPCVWSYVNSDTFAKMSANQQNALKKSAENYETALVSHIAEWNTSSAKLAEDNGVTYYSLSDSEVDEIIMVADENTKAQVDKLNAAGYDGTGIYETFRAIAEKYN
jgi:TRAP-type C4-dicarboxylate transport system substrate-binding protein